MSLLHRQFFYKTPGPGFLVQVVARSLYGYGEFSVDPCLTFKTNGDCTAVELTWSQTLAATYQWMVGSTASLFDIKYVKTSGNATSLTAGTNNVSANDTWYNLNVDRNLALYNTIEFTAIDLAADVSIRWNANSTVISTASCYWYAECTK